MPRRVTGNVRFQAKPMGFAFPEHGRDFVEPSEESGGYKDAYVG